MAGKKILVPHNFSDEDEKALHYVIRTYAGQRWARITLFHAYTPLPEVEGFSSITLGRISRTMGTLSREIRAREASLRQTLEDLKESGLGQEQVDYIFKPREKPVGPEIVDAVIKGGYTTVVLTCRPGRVKHAFTKSVHDSLLGNVRNLEICIIT